MKKPRAQATDSLPAVLGKDEMNLAEYPFALLTSRSPSSRKTFTLTQQILDAYGKVITQTWAVLGSDRYGLPTPYDDDVMLALLYCYKQQNRPGKQIHFTLYELCRIMQRPPCQKEYARLRVALNRLISTTLVATNCFYDNLAKSWVSETFHLFERYKLYQERKRRGAAPPLSFIEMSEVFYRSVALANYIKNLDLALYYGLAATTSKRLFRYLDKNRYHKHQYEEALVKLARKLPLQAVYPSQMKQKLAQAHAELQQRGYLAAVTYDVTPQGEDKVTYTFAAPPAPDTNASARGTPALTAHQLVLHFYSRLTKTSSLPYTPTPKDLALAEEYLITHGPACATFLVRHALEAAKAANFPIQTFGGTKQFLPQALAAWAKHIEAAAAQEAAQEQQALAHCRQRMQERLAQVLQALPPEQLQALEERAKALLNLREKDLGYRVTLRLKCEELILQEYLGLHLWPTLVEQFRARCGDEADRDVLDRCQLEGILEDGLIISTPNTQVKARLTAHYLSLLEELAGGLAKRYRIRILSRQEPSAQYSPSVSPTSSSSST